MLSGEPRKRLGIDITGPHPTYSKSNVYILTVIDHFTKWVELIPMRNQEASTIARHWSIMFSVCTVAPPDSDSPGANFESNLF